KSSLPEVWRVKSLILVRTFSWLRYQMDRGESTPTGYRLCSAQGVSQRALAAVERAPLLS
ncbi:MAG: hypothetical protein KZQ79_11375, partial [Candidatus Thiodiazotropha sp. (ex Lucinoma borealis)]|nr:hypothetical protein [Candidatus Thiodiazotropha sp. (ex Lucinoma borealis)]